MSRLNRVDGSGVFALLILILLLVGGGACNSISPPAVRSAVAVRTVCPPSTSLDYFFPEGALIPQNTDSDRAQRSAIAGFLDSTGAPSLSCGLATTEAYRLLRVGDNLWEFEITVSRNRDSWTLNVTEPRTATTSPMTLNRTSLAIRADDVGSVRAAFETAKFWTMPAYLEVEGEGQVWVIEARVDSSYKVVTRPSYKDDPLFKQLVETFHRISGRPQP